MKKSKMRLSLTLIMALLVGSSTSEAVFAHGGGGRGGGGWHGGAGGWRGGGGWNGGGGWRGGGWNGGGWNGGGRMGIFLGAPIGFNYGYYPYSYYGSPYYGSPYYSPVSAYYPPVQFAPIYTEQNDGPQISPQVAPRDSSQNIQGSWWYYCVDSKTYYPYVNQCPGGWLRVAPQPAPGSDGQPASYNVPAP